MIEIVVPGDETSGHVYPVFSDPAVQSLQTQGTKKLSVRFIGQEGGKMKIMNKTILTLGVILLIAGSVQLNGQLTNYLGFHPSQARFEYTDVFNFIRAYHLMGPEKNDTELLKKEYFDKGTPGLKIYVKKYGLTPELLIKAMAKHPDAYEALGPRLPDLFRAESGFRKAYAALRELIPNAVFPPTYYLVGAHRGIGSGSEEGTLITIEKWETPYSEKATMLVHEEVHMQQVLAQGYENYVKIYGPGKSLLALCIREGTAEFFAHRVTGEITQDKALAYVRKNEKRLWNSFKKDMYGKETGNWMWKKPEDPNQPPHVGYAMGYQIVESYFNHAKDKKGAILEILSVTDYKSFLKKSGYSKKKKK